MPAVNLRQAELPDGADVLENAIGTAPGFAVDIGRARAWFFPGPVGVTSRSGTMGRLSAMLVYTSSMWLVSMSYHQASFRLRFSSTPSGP